MKKIIFSLIFCLVNFCSAFAQTENPPKVSSVSVIEMYQKQCPFNAADFGSDDAVVTAITPPSSPLMIRIEIKWSYEAIKERINYIWINHHDDTLNAFAECEGFYNCAKACYNLGVPMVMEYYSTLDKKSASIPFSVDDLNKLFTNRK